MLGALVKRLLGAFRKPRSPGPAGDFATAYGLYQQGRLDEAQHACEGLDSAPRADVDFLRGLIAEKRGNLDQAVAAMAAALAARPLEPAFHDGLARVLSALREHHRAIEHIERLLACTDEHDPRRVPACVSAARACLALDDDAGARDWFARARALDRDGDAASLLISGALYDNFMADGARAAITAGTRSPGYPARLRRALMLPAVYRSRDEIEATRERLERELDELLESPAQPTAHPVAEIGVTPFYLAYHNRNNVELMRKVCRAVRRAYATPRPADVPSRRDGRARIGFVSRHLYAHSVARAPALGLIRDLPRDRCTVDVFAVAPPDDAMRAAVERAADRYVRLPADLEAVRQAIAAARLDVLVFTDIGMEPLTYFLALFRLAPIQIATWGHSETSGIDTVDYYLSAGGVEIPEAQSHYSERLLRPDVFFLGGYPRPRLAEQADRAALGLPADKHLYACLQPAFKLHPDLDAVFAHVLDRDPSAEIVLLEPKSGAARLLRERFARTLGGRASRLRFLPPMTHPRFLATLACADVALDPLYFGGCNSSVETLSLGVPLVTLPGSHLYGRFTRGLYEELGVRECVAMTTEDYVEKATKLAADRDYRAAISASLRAREHLMFERRDATEAFARIAEELARQA